jgi:hypothetical protein
MKKEELEALQSEVQMLKLLLDFHVRNKDKISMSEKEFEEYVNAVLDKIIEVDNILKRHRS